VYGPQIAHAILGYAAPALRIGAQVCSAPMPTLSIEPIPCLRDNYAYLIADDDTGDAWLVDPSEPGPPAALLRRRGLRLKGILATHHHMDHVGGINSLLDQHRGVWVAGHLRDDGRIPRQTIRVDAPTERFVATDLNLGGHGVQAMYIPGHTLGAIAWYLPPRAGAPEGDVFTGDTLFAAGCGRLFEGSPTQMYTSLQALCALPPATKMWFGHEYTAANLRFAAAMEPDNADVKARAAALPICTTPTTVALERATNPFVRAASAEVLAELRHAKDEFRG
jgi:hydroxyacylglutathione hydrolase